MKRILLATTTLVGAAGLFSGAALADTPKVTIGGYENFEAGYVDDNYNKGASPTQNGVDSRPQAFRSDTQVDFKIDGKSEMGLGYGGEVDLLADTSTDVQGRGVNASKTMVYLEGSNWGRFELGSDVGADSTMKVDAATIARATGGINGDWSYFGSTGNQFLAQAALPLAYGTLNNTTAGDKDFTGTHTEENLDKVTFYTPRFAGFQVGVSYLPDQTNRGQGSNNTYQNGPLRSDHTLGESANIFAGGVNYDNKFGDVGVSVAATGEYGKAQSIAYEDLKAWNAGAKLSYMGFSLAGSYGSWGNSNTLEVANAKDTNYWDLGVAYEYGPFGASVTYLNSQFNCGATLGTGLYAHTGNTANCVATGKDDFQSVSTGVDYKLAPGLTPYAEVTWIDEKTNNPTTAAHADDNKGAVIILGTQLNF